MIKTAVAAGIMYAITLPAQAAVMQAVYTGFIQGSQDYTGVFGSIGSLDGLSANITFTYDTTGGGGYSLPNTTLAYGGGGHPDIISASVTIAGHTEISSGIYNGLIMYFNDGITASTYLDAQQYFCCGFPFIEVAASVYDGSLLLPLDLTAPYSFDPTTNSFASFVFNYDSGGELRYAFGNFAVDHIKISNLTSVPLPSSLAMGFTAIGSILMLRRRRRTF
jgi:hypothetical protein